VSHGLMALTPNICPLKKEEECNIFKTMQSTYAAKMS
jgi:hypothetical protein